jgi:hypothetical protein
MIRTRQVRVAGGAATGAAFLSAPCALVPRRQASACAASAAVPRRHVVRASATRTPVPPSPPPPPTPPPKPPVAPPVAPDAEHQQPAPLVGARELVRALVRAGRAGAVLVVVFYRAKWCRSCCTLAPKVARVAAQARQEPWAPSMDWYSVDIVEENNRVLTERMNVHMLPTFHFYTPIPKSAVNASINLAALAQDAALPETTGDVEDAMYASILGDYLERSFIAGPFGARRLQDNLKDLLQKDQCSE